MGQRVKTHSNTVRLLPFILVKCLETSWMESPVLMCGGLRLLTLLQRSSRLLFG